MCYIPHGFCVPQIFPGRVLREGVIIITEKAYKKMLEDTVGKRNLISLKQGGRREEGLKRNARTWTGGWR